REASVFPAAEAAAACGDPHGPVPILDDASHRVVRQAVPGREGGDVTVFVAEDAFEVRADPDRAVAILVDGAREVARHAGHGNESIGASRLPAGSIELQVVQAGLGAHPETALSVLHHRGDPVAPASIADVERADHSVVEPVQSVDGADPDVSL